ncbi:hypothetical protein [Dechloromonas denitrificans]|uniref:hypothetical protein n=1 Tax=Azonexaceae TaxID=2008795 RepID=UPI001CFC1208|nr:hypothetical protein [Dechloromonas denitrificans]UCV06419.1 hypothetical protein KI615_13435 [Dechloromonas denitrificans]
MSRFNKSSLLALETTAARSAAYLDACDFGGQYCRLDPGFYQACGDVLIKIFAMVDAEKAFPDLLEHSAAAREIADSIQIGRRIELSRLGYYPQLAVLLDRVTA